MPEYVWMCQNSEYLSAPKHAKLLNMTKFWIWYDYQYTSVTSVLNMPEYALTGFRIYLGIQKCQDSKYGSALNMTELCLYMSEFTITYRVLNIYHTIISARSPYKLMSTYWEISVFRFRSKIYDRALWEDNYSI